MRSSVDPRHLLYLFSLRRINHPRNALTNILNTSMNEWILLQEAIN